MMNEMGPPRRILILLLPLLSSLCLSLTAKAAGEDNVLRPSVRFEKPPVFNASSYLVAVPSHRRHDQHLQQQQQQQQQISNSSSSVHNNATNDEQQVVVSPDTPDVFTYNHTGIGSLNASLNVNATAESGFVAPSGHTRQLKGHEKVHHAPHTVQRVEVQEIIKEKSCPVGFDLAGHECVQTEIVTPKMVCPPATTLVDGVCAVFSRARKECPVGFELIGGHCKSQEIHEAVYTCPDGSLDETGHGCKIVKTAPPHCPFGFEMHSHGHCKKMLPAIFECPPGYVMHKKQGCIRQADFDAAPVCPDGSHLEKDSKMGPKCVMSAPPQAKCPKKYALDGNRCVKAIKRSKPECPPGFEYVKFHKICEKLHQEPAQLACPPQARLDHHGQCVEEIPQDPSCPIGYQHGRHPGMCEQIAQELAVCPPPSIPVGEGPLLKCKLAVEHDIIHCCPPGFDMIDGRCERTETFRPQMSCTDCIVVHKQPVEFSCSHGYALNGMVCVRPVNIPCPQPPSKAACEPYAEIIRHHKGHGSLRALAEVPMDCLPSPIVSKQTEVKMCMSEEAVPAVAICPQGGVLQGDVCVITTELIPEPTCPVGRLDRASGHCVKIHNVPVKTECVQGTERSGDRCIELQYHLPDYICPEGTQTDDRGCIHRVAALETPPKIITSAALPICKTGVLQGNVCVDVERAPLGGACPPGSREGADEDKSGNPKCYLEAEMILKPAKVKHLKPHFMCPDGSMAKGKKCKSSEMAPPALHCPPGSVLDPNSQFCIQAVEAVAPPPIVKSMVAVATCPHGSVLQGTKCVKILAADPSIVCPPGFDLGSGNMGDKQCVRSTDFVAMCPHGTTQTPDGCVRQNIAPALVVVHKGCSKEHPQECEPHHPHPHGKDFHEGPVPGYPGAPFVEHHVVPHDAYPHVEGFGGGGHRGKEQHHIVH